MLPRVEHSAFQHATLLPPDRYLQRALYFYTCRSNST